MTWCNESDDESSAIELTKPTNDQENDNHQSMILKPPDETRTITCPSCGHHMELQDQAGIHDLPGLPAGVKFDPTDQEILEHLEAKAMADIRKLHPLIDEFIPTLEGENGICYTHPEKLPGVGKDGQIRHFFHRPSKAYTTGTRKRRKVHTDEEGNETRWHKTGKTRPVFVVGGTVKGFKKILVLYTNYGRQKKPEKTNWVMHQYHLGNNEEEKDGELVVSKVFYQTQPRQCNSNNLIIKDQTETIQFKNLTHFHHHHHQQQQQQHQVREDNNHGGHGGGAAGFVQYYNSTTSSNDNNSNNFINFDCNRENPSDQLLPNLVIHGGSGGGGGGSSFIRFPPTDTSKKKNLDNK